jgi:hypothetical protein
VGGSSGRVVLTTMPLASPPSPWGTLPLQRCVGSHQTLRCTTSNVGLICLLLSIASLCSVTGRCRTPIASEVHLLMVVPTCGFAAIPSAAEEGLQGVERHARSYQQHALITQGRQRFPHRDVRLHQEYRVVTIPD